MADEIDLDLEGEEPEVKVQDKRIKDLSEKVKLTSQERDELAKGKQQAEADKEIALKEVDFFKNFNPLVSKYQGAAEYQDKIKEKVMAGYDIEDATISILAKEGKFPSPAPPKPESPVGGSAANIIKS